MQLRGEESGSMAGVLPSSVDHKVSFMPWPRLVELVARVRAG
jgi:hypothetical protein